MVIQEHVKIKEDFSLNQIPDDQGLTGFYMWIIPSVLSDCQDSLFAVA